MWFQIKSGKLFFFSCEKGGLESGARKRTDSFSGAIKSSLMVLQCWGSCGKLVWNRCGKRLISLKFDLTGEEKECLYDLKAQQVWSFTDINWWTPINLCGTMPFYALTHQTNLSLLFIFQTFCFLKQSYKNKATVHLRNLLGEETHPSFIFLAGTYSLRKWTGFFNGNFRIWEIYFQYSSSLSMVYYFLLYLVL